VGGNWLGYKIKSSRGGVRKKVGFAKRRKSKSYTVPELILGNAHFRIREPGHNVRHDVVQRVPLLRQLSKEQLGQA
jgi:hypothetical protein